MSARPAKRRRIASSVEISHQLFPEETLDEFRVRLVALIRSKKSWLLLSDDDGTCVQQLLHPPNDDRFDSSVSHPESKEGERQSSCWSLCRIIFKRGGADDPVPPPAPPIRVRQLPLQTVLSRLYVRDLRAFVRRRMQIAENGLVPLINKDAVIDCLVDRFVNGNRLTFSQRAEERLVLDTVGLDAQYAAPLCGVDLPLEIVRQILSFSGCSHSLLVSLGATCWDWYGTLLTCWTNAVLISRRNVVQIPLLVLHNAKSIVVSEVLHRADWKHLFDSLNLDRLEELEMCVKTRAAFSKTLNNLLFFVKESGERLMPRVRRFALKIPDHDNFTNGVSFSGAFRFPCRWQSLLCSLMPSVRVISGIPPKCLRLLDGLQQLVSLEFSFSDESDLEFVPNTVVRLHVVSVLGANCATRTLLALSKRDIHLQSCRVSPSSLPTYQNLSVIDASHVQASLRSARVLKVHGVIWNIHLLSQSLVSLQVSCWVIQVIQCARNSFPNLTTLLLGSAFLPARTAAQRTNSPWVLPHEAVAEVSALISERGKDFARLQVGSGALRYAEFIAIYAQRLEIRDNMTFPHSGIARNSVRIINCVLEFDRSALDFVDSAKLMSKVSSGPVQAWEDLNRDNSKFKNWLLSFPYVNKNIGQLLPSFEFAVVGQNWPFPAARQDLIASVDRQQCFVM